LIIGELDPTRALFSIFGCGDNGDLKGALAAAGFAVDRLVLYDALPAETLSIEAAQAIAGGKAAGVLLYSPRSARIWRNLVQAAGFAEKVRRLRHYCLSANVAAALGSDYLTAVASRPQEDALLTLLDPVR
jgi:uroporphyrinogen-III synthase